MRFFIFVIFALFSVSKGEDSLIRWLEGKISGSQGIEGEFIQKTFQGESKVPEVFNGSLVASKPFVAKVNYTKPFEQILYISKDKTVLYTPSDKQAIVSKKDVDLFIDDVIAIFLNNKPLKAVFDTKTEGDKIVLKPKNTGEIKSIEIQVKNDTIQSISLSDSDNNRVEILFKNFRFLTKKENINFELPVGTKIINY